MGDDINLYKKTPIIKGTVTLPGSKSISNRLLILKALYPKNISSIRNISSSDDTKIIINALSSSNQVINVENAGTTMRFLCAFFAVSLKEGQQVDLIGSKRMEKRPIKELVKALIDLGADIKYLKKEGYPPLRIKGKKIEGGQINLSSHISSQFCSALMMIGAKLKGGLRINLIEDPTSCSYIKMTFNLLKKIGIDISWRNHVISIKEGIKKKQSSFFVESDWSAASYYYMMASLAKECDLYLNYFKKESLQGDKKIAFFYKKYFGIETSFKGKMIRLQKKADFLLPSFLYLDLNNTPDLAQGIIVNAVALGIKCHLKGLATLRVKETDRLEALKKELKKIGVKTLIETHKRLKDSFKIIGFEKVKKKTFTINTYEDHRMAMSFAPLAIFYPLKIYDFRVVNKSYPNFWNNLISIGFELT